MKVDLNLNKFNRMSWNLLISCQSEIVEQTSYTRQTTQWPSFKWLMQLVQIGEWVSINTSQSESILIFNPNEIQLTQIHSG